MCYFCYCFLSLKLCQNKKEKVLKGIQWQSQEDRQVWVCFYLACGHLVDNSRQAPPGPRRLGPDPSADREGRPVSPRAAGAGKGRGLRRGEKSVRVLCDRSPMHLIWKYYILVFTFAPLGKKYERERTGLWW